MKLLFDVHLSIKLARHFQQKGIQTEHVNRILSRWNTPDSLIAEFANRHDFILISKDGDFKNSHFLKKNALKTGPNCPRQYLERVVDFDTRRQSANARKLQPAPRFLHGNFCRWSAG